MSMMKVGEISEIWRYPVKGMAGESLQHGTLGAAGLAGDRIWAVRDDARKEIQSCKFRPEMLLLTTATLSVLKKLNSSSDWNVRRFRPNVVIDTGNDSKGLLEQGWIGKQIVLGKATIDCVSTTPRCGAITRAQREFAADKAVLRTVVRDADQNVGVYGTTIINGDLRVGDAVYVS